MAFGGYFPGYDAEITPKNKTVQVGDSFFRMPFRAIGYWVEDADRKNVAKCSTGTIAKALAELLNKTFG